MHGSSMTYPMILHSSTGGYVAIATRGTLDDRENESFEEIDGRIYKAGAIRPLPNSDPFPVDTFPSQIPNIQNVPTPSLANSEFTANLPINTKQFLVRVRDSAGSLRVALASGETDTKYMQVSRGSSLSCTGLNLPGGLALYFKCSKPDQVVEIWSWT